MYFGRLRYTGDGHYSASPQARIDVILTICLNKKFIHKVSLLINLPDFKSHVLYPQEYL